ncbi:MAG: hypothetical protein A3B68_07765 [Candidatus Melainabacteria bacterium RIFCSPHIGHO2_02_FULL_34_12]|nr:MAG: hypothetical protein A3B68_07765 [Candidatus Melainabacteria bacterium RIFCSPHIGHO2_02_FULL_34_12]
MNITMCVFYGFWSFSIGLSLGSFFKLIVDRYGTNESIIYKPSYCSHCKKNLFWWHNIPVLSYLILRGKCYFCKNKIDVNCLYAEVITASTALILSVHTCLNNEPISHTLFLLFFIMTLILLSMFDLKHRIVPHKITYSAITLIIIFQFLLTKEFYISFLNLGIAFLFMDSLYFLTTLFKKFEMEINHISIPVLFWSIAFFFNQNLYMVIFAIFIYFLLLKINLPGKLINLSWFILLFFLSFLIYKSVFINLAVNNLITLFSGIGIIYFVCEIIFYFLPMVVQTSDFIKNKEENETKITIGGGDITVFALISVFSGFKLAFLTLFIASLLATLSHLIIRAGGKYINFPQEKISQYIPLVPFLTLASFIIITFNVY